MELKDKLKKLRQEKNISQQKLADELHTSRSVIAKWETGIAIPQEEYINAIAKYFEIDKNELIESVNKQNIKPNKRNRKFIVLLCSLLMVCVMVFIILSMTLKPERTINKTLNEFIDILDVDTFENINISVYDSTLEEEYKIDKEIYLNGASDIFNEIKIETNNISFVISENNKEEITNLDCDKLITFEKDGNKIELTLNSITYNNQVYIIKEFIAEESFENIVNIIIESTIKGSLVLELNNNEYAIKGLKNNKFSKIVIPESVDGVKITSIGSSAFSFNTELYEIVIPGTVKSINSMAFYGCSYLEKVILENGIESIGANAFKLCIKLKELEIPESVKYIGKAVLSECSEIKKLITPYVGSSLDDLDNSYLGYFFDANNYIDNKTYVPNSLEEVIITNAKTLGQGCFAYIDFIKIVVLPSTLETISENAFLEFNKCESIYFNEPNTKILFESNTFKDASIDGIFWNGSINKWLECEFETIYSTPKTTLNKFYIKRDDGNYELLESIIIPKELTELNDFALYKMDSIKTIEFENGSNLKTIGYAALSGIGISKIIIPKTVEAIGGHAFRYTHVKDVTFEEGSECNFIGSYAFANTYINNPKLPESLYNIGDNAFRNCVLLTEITIPDNVGLIGEKILFDCNNLKKVTIPFLGGYSYNPKDADYIMEEENKITEITINKQQIIPDDCFEEYVMLEKITFGDGVREIGFEAFRDCSSLTTVILGKGIETIKDRAFASAYSLTIVCNLSNLYITQGSWENGAVGRNAKYIVNKIEDMPAIIEKDEYVFLEANNEYYLIGSKYKMGSIRLPDSINGKPYHIQEYAFADNDDITSVTLGKNVLSIGELAFFQCSKLEEIILNEKLERIEDGAFNQCDLLKSIDIPRSVKFLGEELFYLCYGLKYVYIPETVEYLSKDTFSCLPYGMVYVECEEAPETWDYYWDQLIRNQVVMGYVKN